MMYHHNVNALLTMRNVMKLIKMTVANLTMLIMMMIVLTIIHDKSSLMIPNAMYPCSTKTKEVLGNPSPTPRRFPETRDISQCKVRGKF